MTLMPTLLFICLESAFQESIELTDLFIHSHVARVSPASPATIKVSVPSLSPNGPRVLTSFQREQECAADGPCRTEGFDGIQRFESFSGIKGRQTA